MAAKAFVVLVSPQGSLRKCFPFEPGCQQELNAGDAARAYVCGLMHRLVAGITVQIDLQTVEEAGCESCPDQGCPYRAGSSDED